MSSAGALDYRVLNWHLESKAAPKRPGTTPGDKPLKFSLRGNAKLPDWVASFSLPSGHTCPGARECKSRRNITTGKIEDGKHCRWRCFSASQEVAFSPTWQQRYHNWMMLRALSEPSKMARLMEFSLPKGYAYIRLHIGGDFFNQTYFDAWLETALKHPNILFYGYTKSLPFWIRRLNVMPENFLLTASRGGKHDALIDQYSLREAVVVMHPEEAIRMGLEIDHDDSHAMRRGGNFALLIHGVQPKGSDAANSMKRLREEKIIYGYGNR